MGKFLGAILLLAILPMVSFSQKNSGNSADSISQQFIETLKAQGFERIGTVKHYCPGYYRIWKPGERCDYSNDYYKIYVFWEDSSVSFVKKFDNCGSFNAVQMSSCAFFDFFEKNSTTIAGEAPQQFEYNKTVNGKSETSKMLSDHSCRREFQVNMMGENITKGLDLFDLKKKDGDRTNLHYSENNKLKLVEWDQATSKLIWKIEDRTGFVREFEEPEISEAAKEE